MCPSSTFLTTEECIYIKWLLNDSFAIYVSLALTKICSVLGFFPNPSYMFYLIGQCYKRYMNIIFIRLGRVVGVDASR